METRLSVFCDKAIEAGWLAAAVVVPFYFNVYSSRVFEPDKLTWLRIIALVMSVAWVVWMIELGKTLGDLRRDAGRLARDNPLALPTLALVIVTLIATVASVFPAVSFWGSYQRMQGTLTFLSYVTVFFLAATHLRSRAQVDRLISVILWASLPIALYGIIQHLRLDPLPWGGDVTARVTANLGNAIFLPAYLIMVVPLTIFRFATTFRDLIRSSRLTGAETVPATRLWLLSLITGSYGALLIVQLAAIVFAQSRGPWLGLAAGLATIGFLAALRYRHVKLAALAVVLSVVFVAFVIGLNLPNTPLQGLKDQNIYLNRLGTVLDLQTGTNRVRTLIWAGDDVGGGALALIRSDPVRLLIGHGPETMHFAFSPFYPPELAHFESRTATPDRSHDDILDRIITTGVIGLIAYLVTLVTFYRMALIRLWCSNSTYHKMVLIALLGAISAHFVETIFGIAIAATLTYFWLYLAIAAAWVVPAAIAQPAIAIRAGRSSGDDRAYESRMTTTRRRTAERREIVLEPPGESFGDSVRTVLPWATRPSFWVIAGYTVLSLLLFFAFSAAGVGRAMEPAILMMTEFGWLLLGIYLCTHWISRSDQPRRSWRFEAPWPALAYLALWLVALIVSVRVLLATVIADVYFKQAQGIEASGDFVNSIPRHLSAIQWQPEQDYYFLFLGRAYSELARRVNDGPAQRQIATVEDLFTLSPRQIQTREDAFRAASVALEEAYRINPLNVDNAANLGRLYRLWGANSQDPNLRREHLERSASDYARATALSPNTAHLWNEWGLTLVTMGEWDQGIAKMQHALALDPEFEQTYQYLGEAYFQARRYDEAVAALEKAAEINDNVLGVHSMLGYIYFERGDLQRALAENLKAIQIAPNDVPSRRNLAQIYRELGDKPKALEHIDHAIRVAPESQKPQLQQLRQQIEAELR
ncbi:MAG TPA: tetratricopeptide repeat protein [Dehalococcoidia bacterium]|nr:tetratricopeptide repeat protein [Dehalococcoidia bacterium]